MIAWRAEPMAHLRVRSLKMPSYGWSELKNGAPYAVFCQKCHSWKSSDDFRIRPKTSSFRKTRYINKGKGGLACYCKTCEKKYFAHYKNNPENKAKRRLKQKIDPRQGMLERSRTRATAKGILFSLKIEDIIVPDICPALGVKLSVAEGKPNDFSPSLDRINPILGYVSGNVAVISHRANMIKQNATADELEMIAQYIRNHERNIK